MGRAATTRDRRPGAGSRRRLQLPSPAPGRGSCDPGRRREGGRRLLYSVAATVRAAVTLRRSRALRHRLRRLQVAVGRAALVAECHRDLCDRCTRRRQRKPRRMGSVRTCCDDCRGFVCGADAAHGPRRRDGRVLTGLVADAALSQSRIVAVRHAIACALALAVPACTSGATASPPRHTPVATATPAPALVGYLSALGTRDPRMVVAVGQRFHAIAAWQGAGEAWREARFSAPTATRGRSCLQRISGRSGRPGTAEFVAVRPCRVVLYATALGLPGPAGHPAMFLDVVVHR